MSSLTQSLLHNNKPGCVRRSKTQYPMKNVWSEARECSFLWEKGLLLSHSSRDQAWSHWRNLLLAWVYSEETPRSMPPSFCYLTPLLGSHISWRVRCRFLWSRLTSWVALYSQHLCEQAASVWSVVLTSAINATRTNFSTLEWELFLFLSLVPGYFQRIAWWFEK